MEPQQLSLMLIRFIDPYAWFVISIFTFLLGLIGFSPLNYDHNKDRILKPHEAFLVYLRRVSLASIPVFGLALPLLAWFIYTSNSGLNILLSTKGFFNWYQSLLIRWVFPIGWLLVGFVLQFYLTRYIKPRLSKIKRELRVNQDTEKLSDIRDEKTRFATKTFVPEDYYKNNYIFFGLASGSNPIYINFKDYFESNVQILGPTRVGKGVLLGILIQQCIKYGITVIFIDPKGDEFIPHIMADAAKKAGRDFYHYNLNDSTEDENNPGEWAPFVGGSIRSRRARLLTACGLNDTGGESDFYKSRERKIADELLEKTGGRLPLMLEELEKNPEYEGKAERLQSMISQWAKIKSLSPRKNKGLSIEKSLLNNAVVYIKGSLDDEIVREANRILVMEIVQEVRRLKHKRKSHASLIIDEVRFLTSNPLVDSLATIANCAANIVLTYQVKSDVRNLTDKSLDAAAIERSIDTNCQLKFIYGSLDPETNEWAEMMSGNQLKLVTRAEHTKVGELGEETWEHTRTIGQEKEALITKNTMLSLESRVGVLFQPRKLAEIVYTSFVPTEKINDLSRTDVVKQPKIISEMELIEQDN